MKCSVVVRVLNEKNNLYELINILEKQKKIEFELIVIDSGSDDGTVEMLESFQFKYPFYFTSIEKEKFSFGKSLNNGIKQSRFKQIIVSLSAHCFPIDEYYLFNMVKNFDNKSIGFVYGRQIGDERSPLSEVNHLSKWFPEFGISKTNLFSNNGSSSFRYTDWEKIKFNEEVTGCEDILFALELENIHKHTLYEPNSVVTHYHDENFKVVYNRYKRESNLILSLFDHSLKLTEIVRSIFREIYSDISFRKKNSYQRSSIYAITKYRVAKNFGQYFAKKDQNKFNLKYSYETKKKLLGHYYYQ